MDFFGYPIDQVPKEALPVVALFLVSRLMDAMVGFWEAEYGAAVMGGYAPPIFSPA